MECSDGENTASRCTMSAGSRLRGRRRLRERKARWPAVIAVAVCALSVLGAVRAASGASSHTGAVDVDNLNERCELPDGRLGYCLHDYQCHPNFTISTGGLLLETEIRNSDSKRLKECGGFLWCCTDDLDATATTAPTAASTLDATEVTTARFTDVDNLNERCELPDGRLGYCLHDYQCHPNFTISTGGLLLETEIRNSDSKRLTECGGFLWCCVDNSYATATTAPTAASTPGATNVTTARFTDMNECQRGFQNCPWCVALYRRDGDVRRGQVSESGLYCAGALLGTRVVLTSGTCVRTVVRAPVWARVHAARDPGHHYHVVDRLVHHNYNSGSHANDFGLFLLEEDVVWGSSAGGACLQNSLGGICFVPSFDDFETPVLTALTVRDGDCLPRRRNISDMACGIIADATSGGDCTTLPGAPVLCPSTDDGQSGLAVAGVVRRVCVGGAADRLLLGQLWRHADWLHVYLAQYTPRT